MLSGSKIVGGRLATGEQFHLRSRELIFVFAAIVDLHIIDNAL